MCSTHTPTFPDNNALSNKPYNNHFLPGFNSSPGWLLVTRTRGAWRCRYRGHSRSGPRHLSPRSRVSAQEWHSEDIHSHIHSHPAMHTPQKIKNKITPKTKSKTVNSLNVTPSLSCPPPVQSGGGRRPESLTDAPQHCSTSEAFSPRTVLTENISRCVQHKLQHFPTTMPFLTTSTITLSCLASAAPQADSWWLGHVEPWWCRYGGHWRSGPRHPSPRSTDWAQEWHCKDIYWGVFLIHPVLALISSAGHSLTHPILALFLSGEFLLYIPCWLHFHLGIFAYTSHAAFIFIWGVSLKHPILHSPFCGEFHLHIPCCLLF